MNQFISPVIKNRLPDFIKDDYQNFHRFFGDYLDWLESDSNFLAILNGWKNNTEPSNNTDEYLDAIIRDVGFEFSADIRVPKSTLLYVLRDFYLSRGSTQSYELIFKALFADSVKILYPRDRLLWLSSAQYGETHYVFVNTTNFDVEFPNMATNSKKLGGTIKGLRSKLEASIDAITLVKHSSGEYIRIEIQRPLGEFIAHETVQIKVGEDTLTGVLFPFVDLTISDGGVGYSTGDIIDVIGAQVGGVVRVKSTRKGSVDSVTIVDGGSDYDVGDNFRSVGGGGEGFTARVTGVSSGAVTSLEIISGGYNYETIPTIVCAKNNSATVTASSSTIGTIQSINIEVPYLYWVPGTTFTYDVESTGSGASFALKPKTRFVVWGWEDTKGFLGEKCTLPDGDRFQQFSYELVSSIDPKRYNLVVGELLHPVGHKRFNIVDIQSTSTVNSVSATSTTIVPMSFNTTEVDVYAGESLIIEELGE